MKNGSLATTSAPTCFDEGGERSIDVALIADFQDLEFYPLGMSRVLHISDCALGSWTNRVGDEQTEYPRIQDQFGKRLEPLRLQRVGIAGETSEIAPWSR